MIPGSLLLYQVGLLALRKDSQKVTVKDVFPGK